VRRDVDRLARRCPVADHQGLKAARALRRVCRRREKRKRHTDCEGERAELHGDLLPCLDCCATAVPEGDAETEKGRQEPGKGAA